MLLLKGAPIASVDPIYHLSSNFRQVFPGTHVSVNEMLVLGGRVTLPRLVCHDDPTRCCAAVLLVGAVNAAELAAAIEVMPDPAMPIADFAGNHAIRSDFVADTFDEGTLAAAQASFASIDKLLREIPFQATREERNEMLTLRLAYSRARPIEARFDPNSPNLIHYPLLSCGGPKRAELEGLSFLNVLRRRHFMRTHTCERCASNRLLAFEACHDCGSSDLADEAIVHHYRCGCQQPESSFIQGRALICPKCRRCLKHFGMDYGKPGLVVHCRSCGATSPEPDPRFACLDCTTILDGHRATPMDWFHYDLTDAGILALRSGRLPGNIGRTLPEPAQAFGSLREFQLLANAAMRSGRKFSRPFTLAQLTPTNLDRLRGQHGVGLIDLSLQQASVAIAKALPDGEFVTVAAGTILIGFPETGPDDAGRLMAQARAALPAALKVPFEFDLSLLDGNDAIELLSRF
jgi:hypothetical protein